jgi:hypothetical protein
MYVLSALQTMSMRATFSFLIEFFLDNHVVLLVDKDSGVVILRRGPSWLAFIWNWSLPPLKWKPRNGKRMLGNLRDYLVLLN